MRKYPSPTLLRTLFHNLSLPQMPFFCRVPAPCSSAVLSPSSSIKLSHVFLRSAVHSLSHHYTISLPHAAVTVHSQSRSFLPFGSNLSLMSLIPGPRQGFHDNSFIVQESKANPQCLPLRCRGIQVLQNSQRGQTVAQW